VRSIWPFFKVEIRALMREPISVFFMIVVPVILTVVFGGAFGAEATKYGPTVKGIDTVIPVNLAFLLANTGLMGIPITVSELKEQGVLKRYITYPTRYTWFFLAVVLTFALVCLVSLGLFGGMSFVLYGAAFHMSVPQTFAALGLTLVIGYVFFGLGFLLALTIKSARTASLISSGLFMAMLFTSGIVLPLESEPVYVQKAASILPMSHSVNALLMQWTGLATWANVGPDALYLVGAAAVVTLVLGLVKIRWDA
jgi:ABC-2 type transport system permease protein